MSVRDILKPINIVQWIDENKAFLQPPVCNKLIYGQGPLKVMIVGGPNTRSDYHLEAGEFSRESAQEFFYQLKGDMVLKVMEKAQPKDIPIKEGEMFVLPGHIPHSPQRQANTIGLVIERERSPQEIDGLMWFVPGTATPLYREFFHCTDLGTQLKPVIERFYASEAYRKNVPSINPEERIPISIDSESELPPPINFLKWVEQNKEGESIKPLFAKGEFKIDVVQVPENVPAVRYAGKMPGEKLYYQFRGRTELIVDSSPPVPLSENEIVLVPEKKSYASMHQPGSLCLIVAILPGAAEK